MHYKLNMEIKVALKNLEQSNLALLHEWFNSEVAFGKYDQPIPQSYEKIEGHWKKGIYAASLRLICFGQKPIGFVDYIVDPKAPWIAMICVIIADPNYRHRGIGTTAHQILVKEIFSARSEIQKIEAWTDIENRAEQRTLVKVGFLLEGTFRRKLNVRGQLKDVAAFGLLRE